MTQNVSEKTPVAVPGQTGESRTWSLLLGLERDARHAETPEALAYVMVNQTRNLFAYRQAVLVAGSAGSMRVSAISNVAMVERNAPYVVWLQKVLRALEQHQGEGLDLSKPQVLAPEDMPDDLGAEWADWWPRRVWWRPLFAPDGRRLGGLVFTRDDPEWGDAETVLMDHLADAYGHAWGALDGPKPVALSVRKKRLVVIGVIVAVLLIGLVPVRQSVIAPAQIAADAPLVVAAPLDGVIHDILVAPNEPVLAGQTLLVFEPAELEANAEVATRALAVAKAALRRAEAQAFSDPRSKAELTLKRAEVRLKEAEADYAQSLLSRVDVVAPTDGIAVFRDSNEYRGRPVRVGERVMLIADPAKARVAIDLPVSDAIETRNGAKVQMFLDIEPLHPISARLRRTSFEAGETPDGILAYHATADLTLEPGEVPPRLGLRGSAKIYGEPVPLAFYLFRRPLAALRQLIGF